jgi:hypothetical protein
MKAIMGQMSPGMLERYRHIRHAAKIDAVESRSTFFRWPGIAAGMRF